jgi:hypothetical protein
MANQLVNDRKRGERYGDENSEANRKIRKAMFNIVFAVCKAFLPNSIREGFRIKISDGCAIETYQYRDSYYVTVQLYGVLCKPSLKLTGEISKDRMLSLNAARITAERIANGWLPEVLDELKIKRGRKAVLKLSEELGLQTGNAS